MGIRCCYFFSCNVFRELRILFGVKFPTLTTKFSLQITTLWFDYNQITLRYLINLKETRRGRWCQKLTSSCPNRTIPKSSAHGDSGTGKILIVTVLRISRHATVCHCTQTCVKLYRATAVRFPWRIRLPPGYLDGITTLPPIKTWLPILGYIHQSCAIGASFVGRDKLRILINSQISKFDH